MVPGIRLEKQLRLTSTILWKESSVCNILCLRLLLQLEKPLRYILLSSVPILFLLFFSLVDSKLASFSVKLNLVRSAIIDLKSTIGQYAVEIGGAHFQFLSQTTVWVRNELPSNAYFVFQDVIILLDLIGTSNLSDRDFLDG